jgi:hydrogenase-4 component F
MILFALVAVPAAAAVGAYAHRPPEWRTPWLLGGALAHLGLVALAWTAAPGPALEGWLALDALGLIVVSTVSALFAVVASYAVGFLRRENPRGGRAFVSCLLAFLAAASLVALSHHFVLLWIGLEATTLAVAPLIFHRHDRRSLEAVWKYLVISSVGIALALLGVFFLATAQAGAPGRPLVLEALLADAGRLHPAWLKAAFVFLLVGFGTKMGLAPMHTWKPDTYGEAPAPVGGLMAGALTSCAFLAIARSSQVAVAAGIGPFTQPLLVAFGLLSLAVAAAFLIRQRDLRRLLAYSSVEHMGLLAVGLGVGAAGTYGAVLHMINNAFVKGLLFLAVGNLLLAPGAGATRDAAGGAGAAPVSGFLLLIGLFAVTGSPPFGTFLSEFTIVSATFQGGHYAIAATVLVLLAVIFVGLATRILEVVQGPSSRAAAPARESPWLIAGPLVLALAVLVLGVFIPRGLSTVIGAAAEALGGRAP